MAGVVALAAPGCGVSTAKGPACVEVSPAIRDLFDGALITGATVGPASTNGRPRWYYSTMGGATWVSGTLPDGSDAGLTIPMNDTARGITDIGADVPPNAPALNGAADDSSAAIDSRTCASR